MAAKQKSAKKVEQEAAPVKPVVVEEPSKSFDERTQDIQPWLGTEGVDGTRPEPTIEKQK
jgi:hypothetical protein